MKPLETSSSVTQVLDEPFRKMLVVWVRRTRRTHTTNIKQKSTAANNYPHAERIIIADAKAHFTKAGV